MPVTWISQLVENLNVQEVSDMQTIDPSSTEPLKIRAGSRELPCAQGWFQSHFVAIVVITLN